MRVGLELEVGRCRIGGRWRRPIKHLQMTSRTWEICRCRYRANWTRFRNSRRINQVNKRSSRMLSRQEKFTRTTRSRRLSSMNNSNNILTRLINQPKPLNAAEFLARSSWTWRVLQGMWSTSKQLMAAKWGKWDLGRCRPWGIKTIRKISSYRRMVAISIFRICKIMATAIWKLITTTHSRQVWMVMQRWLRSEACEEVRSRARTSRSTTQWRQ